MHPITYAAFFAAVVCIIVAARFGLAGRRNEGIGWLGAGIIFAVLTAVTSVMTAGGYLTP